MEILYSNATGCLTRHADFSSRHVKPRHVDVWCPPALSPEAKTRYPVLYMHDGQNLFIPELSYAGVDWGVAPALLRLMQEQGLPGAIIIGTWNGGDENRWREYMPQKPVDSEQGRAYAAKFADRMPGSVISDSYLKFLVDEVKPFIDASYPTLPDQPNTFVMGSSMGGLISLYALCEYPQVFGGAGCVSTHWLAGENQMVDYFGNVLPTPATHKLYFDFGTETLDAGYEPFQLRMDEHLRKAGYSLGKDWLTKKFPGAEHSEKSWRERVHIPLEFLLTDHNSSSED